MQEGQKQIFFLSGKPLCYSHHSALHPQCGHCPVAARKLGTFPYDALSMLNSQLIWRALHRIIS
jgi:hypothetical protein